MYILSDCDLMILVRDKIPFRLSKNDKFFIQNSSFDDDKILVFWSISPFWLDDEKSLRIYRPPSFTEFDFLVFIWYSCCFIMFILLVS